MSFGSTKTEDCLEKRMSRCATFEKKRERESGGEAAFNRLQPNGASFVICDGKESRTTIRERRFPETRKDFRRKKEAKRQRERQEKKRRMYGIERRGRRRTEDDTLTRLEEIVFLCRDSRHTLRRTLAAGNKLPLEISESLLPRAGPRDRVVARNNFIVFLSRR